MNGSSNTEISSVDTLEQRSHGTKNCLSTTAGTPKDLPAVVVTGSELFRIEMVDCTIKSIDLTTIQRGTPEWERIAREAARTTPGRENGGNCDIKNLSKGSKIYLPIFVEGANLSTSDMHFSQGDGEVSFCGAIEMSGFLELKCEIIKGGMKEYLTPMGPTPLHSGRQHYLDATVAYKRAVLNAIDYLSKFGYSEEQMYLLLSCCPCEGRISGIVDSPNAVATLAIPTSIFDQVPLSQTKLLLILDDELKAS
ncbi:hypothetical protein NL676_022840 [Syzygium grande]|nr:hypothetical protein NL676_022840 [Syzygium grande]